mgnify:CR=1 FL=1
MHKTRQHIYVLALASKVTIVYPTFLQYGQSIVSGSLKPLAVEGYFYP